MFSAHTRFSLHLLKFFKQLLVFMLQDNIFALNVLKISHIPCCLLARFAQLKSHVKNNPLIYYVYVMHKRLGLCFSLFKELIKLFNFLSALLKKLLLLVEHILNLSFFSLALCFAFFSFLKSIERIVKQSTRYSHELSILFKLCPHVFAVRGTVPTCCLFLSLWPLSHELSAKLLILKS